MADISRAELSTLIEEAYSQALLASATASSAALAALPNVNMGTKLTHLPVLASLPTAGWVAESATDASGVKPQSDASWADRTLVAEEIATIIPVHEDAVADASVAVLDEVARLGGQAIGKVLDEAVLFGTNKPVSWASSDLLAAATAAGQTVTVTGGAANASDLVGAVNQAAKMLALAGWLPDTIICSLGLRYDVANLRDSQGAPIFRDEQFAGFNTVFCRNGAWDSAAAEILVIDSSRFRLGVRQDITVKLLDQATVGSINLAERDMMALRIKARYGYVLGDAATSLGVSKVPVAAVLPDAGGTVARKAK